MAVASGLWYAATAALRVKYLATVASKANIEQKLASIIRICFGVRFMVTEPTRQKRGGKSFKSSKERRTNISCHRNKIITSKDDKWIEIQTNGRPQPNKRAEIERNRAGQGFSERRTRAAPWHVQPNRAQNCNVKALCDGTACRTCHDEAVCVENAICSVTAKLAAMKLVLLVVVCCVAAIVAADMRSS
jgi:hypothetical protein